MDPIVMQKYHNLYLQTAQNYLQAFSTNLNGYMSKQPEQNAVDQMFIAIHSIKSQSYVMGYPALGNYCKEIEHLLRTIKDSHQQLTHGQIQILQEAEKKIANELLLIQTSGKDTSQVQPPAQNHTSTSQPGKKILLIEDDPFFERFYAYKLSESGFAVEVAANGEEGLRKLRSLKPNLVLLDLIMPIKDGFEVLAEKSHCEDIALKNTPVIVFSTLGQEEDIQKATELGAVDYVNKSFFDFDQLLSKIQVQIA